MPVLHGFKPSAFVKNAKHQQTINPAELSPERKKLLWAGIKKLDPTLAGLFQNDKDFNELKKQFNATVRFSQSDVDRFTKAGILFIGEK